MSTSGLKEIDEIGDQLVRRGLTRVGEKEGEGVVSIEILEMDICPCIEEQSSDVETKGSRVSRSTETQAHERGLAVAPAEIDVDGRESEEGHEALYVASVPRRHP